MSSSFPSSPAVGRPLLDMAGADRGTLDTRGSTGGVKDVNGDCIKLNTLKARSHSNNAGQDSKNKGNCLISPTLSMSSLAFAKSGGRTCKDSSRLKERGKLGSSSGVLSGPNYVTQPSDHCVGSVGSVMDNGLQPDGHITGHVRQHDDGCRPAQRHYSVEGGSQRHSGDLRNYQPRQDSCPRSGDLVARTVPFRGSVITGRGPNKSQNLQMTVLRNVNKKTAPKSSESIPSLDSSFQILDQLPHFSNTTEKEINILKSEKLPPLQTRKELLELENDDIVHLMPQEPSVVKKEVKHRQRKLKITERSGNKVKQNPRQSKVNVVSKDLLNLSNYEETSRGVSYFISWDKDESLSEKPLEDINLIFEEEFCDNDLIEGAKSNIKTQLKTENALEKGSRRFFQNKEEFYEKFVSALYGDQHCSSIDCSKSSDIKCRTCGPLCQTHDVEKHNAATDHERFYGPKHLPPGLTTDGKCFKKFPITIPVNDSMKYKLCPTCDSNLTVVPDKKSTIKVVDVSGVYIASTINLMCPGCNTARPMLLEEYFENFLFPINCDPHGNVVATFAVLKLWRNLKNRDGSLGEGTFLNSINKHGTCILNQMEFDLLYQQWRHLLFMHSKDIGEEFKDCPAKLSKSTRVHTDGLLKLSRFHSKNHRTTKQTSYFDNAIIVDPQEVSETVKVFKSKGYVSGGDDRCGTGRWTAAENKEKRNPIFDETGMILTTCSHYNILSAVDMEKGEIFALNNIGIMDVKRRGYNIAEANLDIACKFKGWQSRVNNDEDLHQNLPYDPTLKCKLCVGDFHSKGHSTWCNLDHSHKWNGIGRAGGGEQTEVLNSPLAQLRHRERFMKSVRRRDEISEFILERNESRDATIVDEIIAKLGQYEEDVDKIDSDLSKLTSTNKINVNVGLVDILKESAKKILSSNKSDCQEKIEFLTLSLLSKRAQWKSTVDLGLRLKVKGNVESVTKKLTAEIQKYNQENDCAIRFEDALEGFLPWTVKHLPDTIRNNPVVFLKGAELFLKKQRTLEEIDILNEDLVIIIRKRDNDVRKLLLEMENESRSINIRKAMSFKVVLLKEQIKQEINSLKLSKAKKSKEQIQLLKDFRDIGSNCQEKVHDPAIDFIRLLPEDLNFSLDLNPPRCSTPVTGSDRSPSICELVYPKSPDVATAVDTGGDELENSIQMTVSSSKRGLVMPGQKQGQVIQVQSGTSQQVQQLLQVQGQPLWTGQQIGQIGDQQHAVPQGQTRGVMEESVAQNPVIQQVVLSQASNQQSNVQVVPAISSVIQRNKTILNHQDLVYGTQLLVSGNKASPPPSVSPFLTVTSASPSSPFPIKINPSTPFLCEWDNCFRTFMSPKEVENHAIAEHCPFGSDDIPCLWLNCDGMKRKRFALMTHLQDKHCHPQLMEIRQVQFSQSGMSDVPLPPATPPYPSYGLNAAFQTIKSDAVEFLNPKAIAGDHDVSSIFGLSKPLTIIGGTVRQSEVNRGFQFCHSRRELSDAEAVEKRNDTKKVFHEEEPREKRMRANSLDGDDKKKKK